jgi:ABC-type sugar transport system ATPase subunit
MLSLHGVTKRFGSFCALDSVDFRVGPGEVVGLVGANGAGKSTLIKILGGVYPDAQYSGSLDGQPLLLTSPSAALKAGIAVVHQEIDLVPRFTVAENMFLGREPISEASFGLTFLRRTELKRRAERILGDAGLSGLDSTAVAGDLPMEMRQMVVVARALASDSRVVILDEPTARLSPDGRERLFAMIERLRQAGKMLVFVSHHLEEIFGVAHRVAVLRDGRLVADQPTSEFDIATLVAKMIGVPPSVAKRVRPQFGSRVMTVTGLSSPHHFHDVSFVVRSSEVLGITGMIGSGRQEMIRSLIGQHPATGSIRIDGQEVLGLPTAAIVGKQVGFAPEDRKRDGIIPLLSVKKNMSLPWLKWLVTRLFVKTREVEARARELISRLTVICSSPEQEIGNLSGGNQQKVILGRWFGCDAPVVVLESPTIGVDIAGKEEIRQLVRSLAERGVGVVVSTEDMWELEQLTDRVLVIFRGRIKEEFQSIAMKHADLLASVTGVAINHLP